MAKIHKRIIAEDVIDDQVDQGAVAIDPSATELLFEAEEVAELIANVTGQDVEVTADENEVTFGVGDAEYTVEAEGTEEVLESVRIPKRRKPVSASTRRQPTTRQTRQARGKVIRSTKR